MALQQVMYDMKFVSSRELSFGSITINSSSFGCFWMNEGSSLATQRMHFTLSGTLSSKRQRDTFNQSESELFFTNVLK